MLIRTDRCRLGISSEYLVTLSIVTIITLASTIFMLSCTSSELSWDEAEYVAATSNQWGSLWGGWIYNRHQHGPMAIYLTKLGQEVLPAGAGSIEDRLRFFVAFVSSVGIGFSYWTLRYSFKTSRASALVGASLLLLSVIRLEETNIIGPHHLMLVCTLAMVGLGYQWRDRLTLQAAIGLGTVIAFGAVSMSYVIPATLCWAVAVGLAGAGWFAWDRTHFKVSWSIMVMLSAAAIIAVALWPPGVLHYRIISDFWFYLHYSHHPTLVGDRIFEVAPRWAVIYWLAHLDAPILLFSTSILLVALCKAFRSGRLSCKQIYLGTCLAFFFITAMAAHIAGARNLLQFIGVLCLATGALFDEALGYKPLLVRFSSAAIMILAALNLVWFSQISSYLPYLATDGYQAFVKENEVRLREKAKALVYGLAIFSFYSQRQGTPVAWELRDMLWTTRADTPLAADVRYVLMPAFVYNYMPADQPMRHIVAEHWNMVWSFKAKHAWELRLYEKPLSSGNLPQP